MKVGKKLLAVYICLLGIVLVMMASLYSYLQSKEPLPPRDYPEIKEEGILRVMMEYNPSDYYVEDDTILGFQYELCQAIARLSGMEVQIHLEMPAEKLKDGLSLILAQHAIIHKHAHKLVTYGFMNENCRNGRVNTAGKTAENAARAHLFPYFPDSIIDE